MTIDEMRLDSTDLIQWVKALETEILRLQTLVSYLLHKNEQLRSRTLDGNSHVGADAPQK
jgi:hypothetical protein